MSAAGNRLIGELIADRVRAQTIDQNW